MTVGPECFENDLPRLFLHATNIHQGGGKTLLVALLTATPHNMKVYIQVDSRLGLSVDSDSLVFRFVQPSIKHRLNAELWLKQNVRPQDVVLCLGNLPPLFKLRGHVSVFLHNRYLIDYVKLNQFPLKTRLRLMAERLWLTACMSKVDEFVVQTPSMKKLLEIRTGLPVRILPFLARHEKYLRKTTNADEGKTVSFDFVYVASGEPHKNHRKLIEAWCLLAEEGLLPSLKLTLDDAIFPELCDWMREKKTQYGLKIENLGRLPHEQILELYRQARALVYPSIFESFGLPLIEARQAGLPILASELDYVRDVIDTDESFDPSSAVSIARAVKRFLQIKQESLPLLDATDFLKQILGRTENGVHIRH